VCWLEDYSYGVNNFFTYSYLGNNVTGTDVINFRSQPSISRVSGCHDVGNKTTNCPTGGALPLTIFGSDLAQPITIQIDGRGCVVSSLSVSGDFVICSLPPGTGLNRNIRLEATGLLARPVDYLSYALPTVCVYLFFFLFFSFLLCHVHLSLLFRSLRWSDVRRATPIHFLLFNAQDQEDFSFRLSVCCVL
jgi:hypothetical protein